MTSLRLLTCLVLCVAASVGVARGQQAPPQNAAAAGTAAETELHRAARTGDVGALQSQLKLGANPNARDQAGRTPLIDAIEHGQLDAAKILIQAGADLNVRSRLGTALEIAERTGHSDIAAALREAGARTFGRSVGDTVCVRPWGGDGYCGKVESIGKNAYTLRVTQIVGCEQGCAAKTECSAGKPVGGTDGIAAGDLITTKSWCLTQTGVQP
jgi:Ankyrin repeats (3 copies)